jgi:hypothetical protein|tara:strand:- start:654 stop:929 length:276 start_codon:yes stop_codon:yes gene_type:complete
LYGSDFVGLSFGPAVQDRHGVRLFPFVDAPAWPLIGEGWLCIIVEIAGTVRCIVGVEIAVAVMYSSRDKVEAEAARCVIRPFSASCGVLAL